MLETLTSKLRRSLDGPDLVMALGVVDALNARLVAEVGGYLHDWCRHNSGTTCMPDFDF